MVITYSRLSVCCYSGPSLEYTRNQSFSFTYDEGGHEPTTINSDFLDITLACIEDIRPEEVGSNHVHFSRMRCDFLDITVFKTVRYCLSLSPPQLLLLVDLHAQSVQLKRVKIA